VLFRPSTKGKNFITMSWRFFTDPPTYVHFAGALNRFRFFFS
jgi:hypothetical protein